MSAVTQLTDSVAGTLTAEQRAALEQACARIAPTWPLDQLIAVNPWWELRMLPLEEASARIAALAHARCVMPEEYFVGLRRQGIGDAHLEAALGESPLALDLSALDERLTSPPPSPAHWHNFSDLLDARRDRRHNMAWRDEITHQVSQFCAAVFQRGGALRPPELAPGELYRRWLVNTRQDRGIAILMGETALAQQFERLPLDREQLLAEAFAEHEITPERTADYAHALLLDVNGWASWIAWLRWQDRLAGRENDLMADLLAIRLGWELALSRHQAATDPAGFGRNQQRWRQQLADWPRLLEAHLEHQRPLWVSQRAAEIAWQETLHAQLREPVPPVEQQPVAVQAAFCIDVRSEVFRRALEAQHPGIQTLGFAGFFGLPIEYDPAGTDLKRPQLPGLLAPTITASETGAASGVKRALGRDLNRKARWSELPEEPPASFSFVEATGLLYAFKLLRDSLFPGERHHPVNDLHAGGEWRLLRNGEALGLAERAELAAGVLHAMGLEADFAPVVLLVGHGSSTTNNPHAAGLDCGACGGQTGEVNVRVLAMLLNDPALRGALRDHGIVIPGRTRFVGALHDTTTDEVHCFDHDLDELPEPRLAGWLQAAGAGARRERAPALGLAGLDDAALEKAVRKRSRDWSQVRPEWGLAGNAAFIVAPRHRTRHLELRGRAFLHDYDWRRDPDFSVLELIMTAPMLVTHWINFQYYASVTDNHKYGCGNKVLHNVVGGNIGVFEGNGGDLRIGLPMQSLHDGERWMHEPLRLGVYLAAPRGPIEDITGRHETVRQLVDNGWLYLFRLDDDGHTIERFRNGAWHEAAPTGGSSGISVGEPAAEPVS